MTTLSILITIVNEEIEDAFSRGNIGSLIGIEGGHVLESSLANLRASYELGARYLTLTHTCDLPW